MTFIDNIFTVLNSTLGTINYNTGDIVITKLKTSAYNEYISLYLVPQNTDVIANKDIILIIDPADLDISIINTVK